MPPRLFDRHRMAEELGEDIGWVHRERSDRCRCRWPGCDRPVWGSEALCEEHWQECCREADK